MTNVGASRRRIIAPPTRPRFGSTANFLLSGNRRRRRNSTDSCASPSPIFMEASGAKLSLRRTKAGAKSTTTPVNANKYPSASSLGACIGIRKGDQFVRRKVYVSKRRDKPAITSVYPTHLLGGVAILDLDSLLNIPVPQDCPATVRKSSGLLSMIRHYPQHVLTITSTPSLHPAAFQATNLAM
jgi:hypothetical protein